MNALVEAQIANNSAMAENWAAFAGHRARVTALLRARGLAFSGPAIATTSISKPLAPRKQKFIWST
jgi:hypothetical protein